MRGLPSASSSATATLISTIAATAPRQPCQSVNTTTAATSSRRNSSANSEPGKTRPSHRYSPATGPMMKAERSSTATDGGECRGEGAVSQIASGATSRMPMKSQSRWRSSRLPSSDARLASPNGAAPAISRRSGCQDSGLPTATSTSTSAMPVAATRATTWMRPMRPRLTSAPGRTSQACSHSTPAITSKGSTTAVTGPACGCETTAAASAQGHHFFGKHQSVMNSSPVPSSQW